MDKIMNDYNRSHIEDSENNYLSDDEITINLSNKEIADNLYNNYENMTIKEKQETLLKCINPSGVGRELLKFELKHYKPEPTNMNKEEFINKVKELLNRYQHKACGFYIEDDEWDIYEDDFKDKELDNNELYFENSIDRDNAKNNDTLKFIVRTKRILNNIATNVKVRYELEESRKDDITWIYIIATFDKSIRNNTIEIGL
jgi:hypothetical protein